MINVVVEDGIMWARSCLVAVSMPPSVGNINERDQSHHRDRRPRRAHAEPLDAHERQKSNGFEKRRNRNVWTMMRNPKSFYQDQAPSVQADRARRIGVPSVYARTLALREENAVPPGVRTAMGRTPLRGSCRNATAHERDERA